jgi:hypothetical protein
VTWSSATVLISIPQVTVLIHFRSTLSVSEMPYPRQFEMRPVLQSLSSALGVLSDAFPNDRGLS